MSLAIVKTLILLAAAVLGVGDKAPDFQLSTPDGKMMHFSEMNRESKVVLVVLRGYPGYQCPYCNRQFQDFMAHADAFAQAGVHVLFVYPGPPDDLAGKAKQFLADRQMPAHFTLVVDPDYTFTNRYSLRWEAKNETAYPSTFVVDREGMIRFVKVSRSHGGRTSAAEVLAELSR